MGSKPRISSPTPSMRRLTRKSSAANPLRKPQDCHRGGAVGSSVSNKLEALKHLIPSADTADIKPDHLYQETADYIVLLKSQVFVLQKLIDFYGSQPQHNRNAVFSSSAKDKAEN